MSANLEAPDLEAWLKLQPLPFPRKGIAHNLFAVADAAIVEVGCYCGEGDRSKHYWNCESNDQNFSAKDLIQK